MKTAPVTHAAALFDLDNTMLQGVSVYHLARGLYRRKFFTGTEIARKAVDQLRLMARRLGLTGALGTIAETRDGVCTGRLGGDILHGPAEAEAVRAPAAHEGLHLADCAAYSDSVNDLPMLELVGNPCAIHPDSRLRRHAEVAGWRVRDYRTGRKAARRVLLTAGASGVTLGAVSAAVAIRGSVLQERVICGRVRRRRVS
ncbi:MAG: hypothetical protein QOH84_188 [Kribbellaceae bacterium]|nr:hypothetical protein [Kribbellaceae bacterium]